MNPTPLSKTEKTLNRQSIKQNQMRVSSFKNFVLKPIMKHKMLPKIGKGVKTKQKSKRNRWIPFCLLLSVQALSLPPPSPPPSLSLFLYPSLCASPYSPTLCIKENTAFGNFQYKWFCKPAANETSNFKQIIKAFFN